MPAKKHRSERKAKPSGQVVSRSLDHVVLCSDVLKRAISIMRKGPLPRNDREHGKWCPYCAIAMAKGQLDDERGSGLPLDEVLRQLVTGIRLTESDAPLDSARKLLGNVEAPFTQKKTIAALKKALTQNTRITDSGKG